MKNTDLMEKCPAISALYCQEGLMEGIHAMTSLSVKPKQMK